MWLQVPDPVLCSACRQLTKLVLWQGDRAPGRARRPAIALAGLSALPALQVVELHGTNPDSSSEVHDIVAALRETKPDVEVQTQRRLGNIEAWSAERECARSPWPDLHYMFLF